MTQEIKKGQYAAEGEAPTTAPPPVPPPPGTGDFACYTKFRAQCATEAVLFERAAELQRSRGTAEGMARAYTLSEQAIRLRYLADFDPDVALPYEAEARR